MQFYMDTPRKGENCEFAFLLIKIHHIVSDTIKRLPGVCRTPPVETFHM